MASKSYSMVQNYPTGTTGTGLDQTVERIGIDPGLAGANLGTNITVGMTAANELNQLILEAKQATGVASNGIFTVSDVIAINAWIRANRLAEFTALHGDDDGTTETGFHLVQNDGATQQYRNQNLVDTVFDGIYHIGFLIQNGTFLNEDGNANATVAQVADWLTQFYTDRATTNTGLDRITELIIADQGLAQNIPWQEIAGGADAANGLNDLLKTAITTYNLAADGSISESDIAQINNWIRSDATRYNAFVVLHGDDDGTTETGFHLVQNDGAQTTYFAKNLVNTVADGIYHIGFQIQNGRFLNEDGAANATVKDVADWVTYFYVDQSTTGTGLDKIVDTIKIDTGLAKWTNAGDINAGAAAADGLNHLLVDGITATGIAADGWITSDDIRTLNQWIRTNHYDEFILLHGDDEGNEETGYHLVQNDGATTQYFGKNLVNTVADGLYHIGFNIQDNRLLNEDGDANARLNDVSSWLNYFYLQKTIIYGDNSGDTITGTNLAEHLMGYGGNDVLSGGDGDDLIDGDWGSDTLSGGVGNDLLYGGADNDQLDGGEGSDTYYVSGNLAGGWSSFQGYDIYTDTGTSGVDKIVALGTGDVDLGIRSFSANSGIETIDGTGVTGKVTIVGDWSDNTLDFSNTAFVGNNIQINGYWGNDNITGTTGNDVIIGGGGDDKLNGGNGSDQYVYTGYQSNEWSTFEGYDTITDTGTTGTDTIVAKGTGNVDIGLKSFGVNSGIETIDGTGVTGKVTIVGDGSDNTFDFSNTAFVGNNIQINGYWGNDNITGNAANNVIIGGGGDDKLNGGNGSDQYVYTGYQSNEWNTFEGYDTITDTGTTGTDTIVAKGTGNVDIGLKSFGVNSGIETIDGTGVTGKVTIVGDWSDNTLDFSNTAFVGNNIQINGYWGNDNITGTTGNDVIIGGGGDDKLNGGNGSDQYVYTGYQSNEWNTFEGYDTITDTGTTGTDTIVAKGTGNVDIGLKSFGVNSGIETIDGTGVTGKVTIVGDWSDNTFDFSNTAFVGNNIQINGYWGNDNITGTTGNDVIIGGGGDDKLNGGNGSDQYVYTGYQSNEWNTFEGYDTITDTGTTGTDTIVAKGTGNVDIGLKSFGVNSGIETIDGTGVTGKVTIVGDGSDNTFDFSNTAFVGNNIQINGYWGNDNITGTTGNDVIIGGGGDDKLNGGNGSDQYVYTGYQSNEWNTFEGYDTITDTGTTGTDTIVAKGTGNVDIGLKSFGVNSGIETIDGTGVTGKVTIVGDWSDNTFDFSNTAFVGNNIQINGYWGNDNITGTTGNDVIIGGGGDDKLNGGNGSDQYVYTGYQSNEWNTFEGYDTITDTGTTGTDTIVAKGTGNVDIGLKSFGVNSGIETIDGTGVTGKVTIVGDGSDNTFDFSNTAFVGNNIQINGYWGNDNITGTTGNDVIIGGGGDDKLNGGNGSDQYVYTGYQSNEWNTFEGYDTITDTGTTGTDTIVAKGTGNVDIGLKSFGVNSGIETIDGTGVTGKVTIVGDWSDNTLDFSNTAFVGNNIQINGYWGNDNITGTTGNDVIIGGGGEDKLNGGSGEDILIGGLGSDQLTGGEGPDRFIFNTVDEIGQGANQDNILDFNTGLDTIDISGIDANSLNAGNQSFTFIGASDFSSQAGQLRFYGGLLCGDTNGDAVSDFQLAIAGVYSLPVTNIVL